MKKTKLFITASLSLLLGLGIVSCNKQDAQPLTAPAAKHSTAMSASPGDDVGALHNKGLDYYIANADFSDPKGCVIPLAIKYVTALGADEKAMTTMFADPDVSAVINSSDGLSTLGTYFTAHGMKTENGFLTSITRAIASAATPDEVAASLDAIGTGVSASKDLTDDGKTALLGAIAVGKASSSYWYTQVELGESSQWIKGLCKEPLMGLDFSWRSFFAQDIAGAWVGGLFGGPWGLVGGAVGGSVADAVGQLSAEKE